VCAVKHTLCINTKAEVCPMRLRYKPWADEFIKQNQHLILPNAEVYKGQWNAFFNNNHPIHLEIGTGKGQFIAEMSRKYSDINFIGIERAKSVIADAVEKIYYVGTHNDDLMNKDASELTYFFATKEIDVIYSNFSAPCPKSRHKRRRLTYHTFLRGYQEILSPRGEIILKTD